MGYSSASRKPIKVTVGGSVKPVKNKHGLVVTIATAVLVIVVVMFMLLQDSGATNDPETRTEPRVKRQQPPPARIAKADTNESASTSKPNPVTAHVPKSEEQPPLTPEEIEAIERAKDPLYDRHHIVAKPPIVSGSTDQLIVSIFSTELGDMPPMIPVVPRVEEDKLRKTINDMLVESDSDTDESRAAKALVNEVKVELKKYLDDGGNINSFLEYYYGELDSAFTERNLCQEAMSKAIRNSDREIALQMYYKLNERLSEKGIKPLRLNSRQKEYLGINN